MTLEEFHDALLAMSAAQIAAYTIGFILLLSFCAPVAVYMLVNLWAIAKLLWHHTVGMRVAAYRRDRRNERVRQVIAQRERELREGIERAGIKITPHAEKTIARCAGWYAETVTD